MKQEIPLFHHKRFIVVIAAVLLAIAALLFHTAAPAAAETPTTVRERLVRNTQIITLHENLQRAMVAGRIKVDEWEKLDFTLPSDDGFGDNVEYEVFNPKSPRTVIVEGKPSFPLVPQDLMDDITTKPDQILRFSLPRFAFYLQEGDLEDKMEVQSLAAVISNAHPDHCDEIRQFSYYSLTFGISREFTLQAQPDSRGMLQKQYGRPGGLYEGCVRLDQAPTYVLIPLAYRTRLTVGKQEAAWHNIKARRIKPPQTGRETYFLP